MRGGRLLRKILKGEIQRRPAGMQLCSDNPPKDYDYVLNIEKDHIRFIFSHTFYTCTLSRGILGQNVHLHAKNRGRAPRASSPKKKRSTVSTAKKKKS